MHRRRTLVVFVLFLLGSLLPATWVAAAKPNFQEGQWEYEVKMDMPGMPANMPPMKYSQCLTHKDVVPQPPQGQADCKNLSHKVNGDTVTWRVQCQQGETRMEGQGSATYKAERMQATIKNTMTSRGQPAPFTSTSHITGRRVGACKATK